MLKLKPQIEFIGRDDTLALLQEHLEHAMSGTGNIIFVEGEIGIGKTRLIERFKEHVLSKEVCLLSTKCFSSTIRLPYLPFIEVFGEYFQKNASTDKVRKSLGSSPPHIVEMIPGMANVARRLGVVPKGTATEGALSGLLDERGRMFEHLSQLMLRISNEEPIVILMDDIGRMDVGSLSFLRYVAHPIKKSRILICVTYNIGGPTAVDERKTRSIDQIRAMGKDKLLVDIKLKSLGKETVAMMLKALTDRDDVPNVLVQAIYKRSRGNPLFVEEFMRSLTNANLVAFRDGQWVIGDLTRAAMPTTVREIIEATLSKLDGESRSVATWGAVMGERFSHDVLSKVVASESTRTQLDGLLSNLIENGVLLRAMDNEDAVYTFRYPLLSQLLYDDLTGDECRSYHSKIAHTLEDMYRENIDKELYSLGMHFAKANEHEKAVEYSLKAGEKAEHLFAPDIAVRHYETALNALKKLSDTDENKIKITDVLRHLGDMYRVLGELDNALRHFDEVLRLSKELGDERRRAEAYIDIGEIKSVRNEWTASIEDLKMGLQIAESNNDTREIAEAYRDLGYVSWRNGKYDEALAYFNKTMQYAKELNDPTMIAYVYVRIGTVYSDRGDQERAKKYLLNGIATAEKHNDLITMAMAYNNLGEIYRIGSDYNKAIEYFRKQHEISKKIGFIRLMGFALTNTSNCYAKLGDLEKAKEYADEALGIFTKIDEKYMIAGVHAEYGIIYRFEKNWDAAIEHFSKSISMLDALKMPYDLGEKHFEFALMYRDKDNPGEAIYHLEQARRLFTQLGSKGYLDKVNVVLTELKTHRH